MRRFAPLAVLLPLLTLGAGFTAAPAEAGQVTLHIRPHGRDAQALRQGLQLFGLFQNFKNRARVSQSGSNNAAGIAQYGRGDTAAIFQNGSGNSGGIVQRGNNDALALFQFGKHNTTTAEQNGNGEVGIVLQGGW